MIKKKTLVLIGIPILVISLTIIIYLNKPKETEKTDQWYEPKTSSSSVVSSESSSEEQQTEETTTSSSEDGTFVKIPSIANEDNDGGIDKNSSIYKETHEVREPTSEATLEELKKPYNERDYSVIYLTYGEFEYVLENILQKDGFKIDRVLAKDSNLYIYISKDGDIDSDKVKENAKNFLNTEVLNLIPVSAYNTETWINNKDAIKIVWND